MEVKWIESQIIFAVVAIVGGMIYISTQNRRLESISDINNDQLNTTISAESENGNITECSEIGSKDAKAAIIEYADYQCPGCGTAAQKASAS